MAYSLQNNSDLSEEQISMIEEFLDFFFLDFDTEIPLRVSLRSEKEGENGKILGPTGFYQPGGMLTLICHGRHLKDILKTLSHELIHFKQDCDGKLDKISETKSGYTQKDSYLREIEKEAYLNGGIFFRDWEDGVKNHDIRCSPRNRKALIGESKLYKDAFNTYIKLSKQRRKKDGSTSQKKKNGNESRRRKTRTPR